MDSFFYSSFFEAFGVGGKSSEDKLRFFLVRFFMDATTKKGNLEEPKKYQLEISISS